MDLDTFLKNIDWSKLPPDSEEYKKAIKDLQSLMLKENNKTRKIMKDNLGIVVKKNKTGKKDV